MNIEIVPAELTTNIFNGFALGLWYKEDNEKSNNKGNTHKDQKDVFMHGTLESRENETNDKVAEPVDDQRRG